MLNQDEINKIINTVKDKAKPNKIYLFGSYAYGKATEKSDLDLLVEFPPGFTLFKYSGLIIELQEMLGLKVDVVSQNKIKLRYKEKMTKEAIPL